MRRHATLLGLTLALAACSVTGAVGQEPSPQKKAEITQQPKNEAADKLLKIQLQAAQKVQRAAVAGMEVRQIGGLLVLVKGNAHARPDLVYLWSVRWLHAQRDLSATKEERIAAFTDHQKRMKELRDQVKLLVGNGNSGLLADSEVPAAEWYLAEAELWLLREQGK